MLTYIEERLGELEDEKEELKEFQELDRDKRAIEYTIHDKDLRNTRATLGIVPRRTTLQCARPCSCCKTDVFSSILL